MRGHVFLVGFMGCGKSTVGAALAAILSLPFVDLDRVIEDEENLSVAEIFKTRGEPHFRAVESRRLAWAAAAPPSVVAVGGGAFANRENRDLMQSKGVAVWLDVPLEVAWERCAQDRTRPLAAERGLFERLFRERRPGFGQADLRVEVGGREPETIAREIAARLGGFEAGQGEE